MGTSFDAFKLVQKQLRVKRSGEAQPLVTKAKPDAAKEKEVQSMGSKYKEYPPLDRTQLRQGYHLCLENARGLMNDATKLKEAGSLRPAYLIVLLAVEELRKATQLYEAGRSEVRNWEAWWGRYFNHPMSPETGGADEAGERSARGTEELLCVDFDRKDGKFVPPREDQDSELLKLFEKEAAHAEGSIKALPAYAFERWEFQELAQQAPGVAALYAGIKEILSQAPTISEKKLLTTVALDLDMSPDDFAAGFERWREVTTKARVYVDRLGAV